MDQRPNPLREIVQPFIDAARAPRALWGNNLQYFLEGFLYFGILNYLAPGLSDSFWESYPLLEGFWIMEGSLAPAILSGMVLLYLLLYVVETARGDMSS